MADGREKLMEQTGQVKSGKAAFKITHFTWFYNKGTKCLKKVFLSLASVEKAVLVLKKQYPSKESLLALYRAKDQLYSNHSPQREVCSPQVENEILSDNLLVNRCCSTYPPTYNCMKTLSIFNSMQLNIY